VCATEEWRRELAVKGRGDPGLKREALRAFACHLQRDDVDCVLQPMFISPLINLTDILCSVQPTTGSTRDRVLDAILQNHPFPFLERFVDVAIDSIPAQTQVFIPLATVARHAGADWMAFSVGPRGCPGQQIGMCLLEVAVRELAHSVQFKPLSGHQHGGRHNDHTIGSLWFFLTFACKAILAPYHISA
jgi:hypothetical protein